MHVSDRPETSAASPRHAMRGRTREAQGAGRGPLIPVATLLVVALLFGGSAEPLSELAIELIAILTLLVATIGADRAFWDRTRLGWFAILASLAIAAYELVPLPYGLWRALPGHAPFADILDAAGLGGGWRSLSLDSNATMAALLATLPGLAACIATLALGHARRRLLAMGIIAGAVASALLGCLQIGGGSSFYLYEYNQIGNITGFFANHNHAADQFLVAIALTAAWLVTASRKRSGVAFLVTGVILVLAVATLLTASRTGAMLLALLCLSAPILFARRDKTRALQVFGLMLVAVLAVGALYLFNSGVGQALDRFDDVAADLRPAFWRATARAIVDFLPTGSGLGSFVPIYPRYEILDTMPSQVVNHAHSEFLELALELGLIGMLLPIAYLVLLAWGMARAPRLADDALPRMAGIGILVLLGSSIDDFPLRNASAMVVFGILNGLVFAGVETGPSRSGRRSRTGQAPR